MKKMYLLFSHLLTDEQVIDARESLGVEEFVYLPKGLKEIWSNVPPQLESLNSYLNLIKEFIKEANKKDYVLIQGDFGAVYEMVNFSKQLDLIPLYATTKRESIEEKIGDKIVKKSFFKHIRYRFY